MRSVVFFVCVLLPLCGLTRGLRHSSIVSQGHSSEAIFHKVAMYGFKKSGRLDATVQVEFGSLLQVLLLDYLQTETIEVNQNAVQDPQLLCDFPFSMRLPVDTNLSISFVAPKRDLFSLYLLNCDRAPFRAQVDFVMLNPGNEEISLEDKPLPILYMGLLLVYCIIWAVWLNCLPSCALVLVMSQRLLCVSLVLLTSQTACLVAEYHSYAVWGGLNARLEFVQQALGVLGSGFLLAVGLVVCVGHMIMFVHLKRTSAIIVSSALTSYVISGLLHLTCPTYSFFFSLLHTTKFVMTFMMVVLVNMNVERLRSALAMEGVAWEAWSPSLQDLCGRMHMYTMIRLVVLCAYFVVPVGVLMLDLTVLKWHDHWVIESCDHVLDAVVACVFAYFLLPRESSVGLFIIHPSHTLRNPQALALSRFARPRSENDDGEDLFDSLIVDT